MKNEIKIERRDAETQRENAERKNVTACPVFSFFFLRVSASLSLFFLIFMIGNTAGRRVRGLENSSPGLVDLEDCRIGFEV